MIEDKEDRKEYFKEFLSWWLKQRPKDGEEKNSREKLAGLFDKHISYITNIGNGSANLTDELLEIVEGLYGKNYSPKDELYKNSINKKENVPYYDIDATAGQIEVFNDYHEQPTYFMHLPNFKDCDFACNVSGDSMYPQLSSGEVILCKEVRNRNIIQYGETYLVVCNEKADNLRTIKRIRKHKTNQDLLTLHPSNPNFDDFDIPKDSIIKLYAVKGSMKRRVM